MASRFGSWFKQLSTVSKVAVIGVGIAGTSVISHTVADPHTTTYMQAIVNETVPFSVTTQDDDTMLATDAHKVLTQGKNGSRKVTYKITKVDGRETNRQVIKTTAVDSPTTQIEAVGIRKVTTVTEQEAIPFSNTTVNDPALDKGTSKITTTGVNGSKNVSYEVTSIKDKVVSKEKTSEQVTLQPVTQITTLGTKGASVSSAPKVSNCDPNYSGGCVPIASDVDCGSGRGNGPAYFYGTARVVGMDIYGLDGDGDGIACE